MISIPVGCDNERVPVGLAIINSAWKDHLLIKFGSAIEDLVQGRSRPTFRNMDAENYLYVGGS